uniref:Prolyl 4-hydroxylase alpha-subunit N-terminal domain-containing protein n=1 Tax=Clastoptera arizonana TaxID=38151 RepID=A0A1B6DVA0_9HEMI
MKDLLKLVVTSLLFASAHCFVNASVLEDVELLSIKAANIIALARMGLESESKSNFEEFKELQRIFDAENTLLRAMQKSLDHLDFTRVPGGETIIGIYSVRQDIKNLNDFAEASVETRLLRAEDLLDKIKRCLEMYREMLDGKSDVVMMGLK